jgi:hypothetical protein
VDPNTGITVQGVGRVSVEPDIGLVTLGVEVEAATVSAARERAAVAAEAVVQSVLANGVAERDVQTVSITIHPRYDYSTNGSARLLGFSVSNLVSVTVRDLDRFGEIIDDAAGAGGDAIRINGIQFAVEDNDSAVRQARVLALENAADAAAQLAAAAGIELGPVLLISEVSASLPSPVFAGVAGAEDAVRTPIHTGTEPVQVTLTVRYAIE